MIIFKEYLDIDFNLHCNSYGNEILGLPTKIFYILYSHVQLLLVRGFSEICGQWTETNRIE